MTMGWHMMLGFSPALFGCYIWDDNHNQVDKFAKFGLTARPATKVKAPLIAECYANFECRLHDGRMIRRYGLFIWEVVKAHVAASPKRPQTIHYRGDGEFMLSGAWLSRRGHFKSDNL
jgi:flavin reductase (DIM6/NTAB) family NADH-FMN oxidoreductase RutF